MATSLGNLASLYTLMGQYAKATPLHWQVLAIREKKLGADHPDVAVTLNNLAHFYGRMGQYAKAEPLYLRSLAIWEKKLGANHPDVARSLGTLASLYVSMGQYTKAEPLRRRSLTITSRQVDDVFSVARSEQEKLAFVTTMEGTIDGALSMALLSSRAAPRAVRTALDAQLRFKGIVLKALSREREAVGDSADEQTNNTWKELVEARRQHAALTLAGPDALKGGDYRKTLEELSRRKGELEDKLGRLLPSFAEERRARRADAAAVAAALPADAVLVEIARPDIYDFKATGKQARWKPARYLAFVLRRSSEPQLVDLGEAAAIDEQVSRLRSHMARASSEVASRGEAVMEDKLRVLSRKLYSRIPGAPGKALAAR